MAVLLALVPFNRFIYFILRFTPLSTKTSSSNEMDSPYLNVCKTTSAAALCISVPNLLPYVSRLMVSLTFGSSWRHISLFRDAMFDLWCRITIIYDIVGILRGYVYRVRLEGCERNFLSDAKCQ